MDDLIFPVRTALCYQCFKEGVQKNGILAVKSDGLVFLPPEGQSSDDAGPVIVNGSTPSKKGKQPVLSEATRLLCVCSQEQAAERLPRDSLHLQAGVRGCWHRDPGRERPVSERWLEDSGMDCYGCSARDPHADGQGGQ